MGHWDQPQNVQEKTPGGLVKALEASVQNIEKSLPCVKETLRQRPCTQLYFDEPFRSLDYAGQADDAARDVVASSLRNVIVMVEAYMNDRENRQVDRIKKVYSPWKQQLSQSLIQTLPQMLAQLIQMLEDIERQDQEYRT